jgi:fumarylacetoacetase
MSRLDETHDPALASWVASAQAPEADFTIQNLPFGVVRRRGCEEPWRVAVAIGDQALDLAALGARGLLGGAAADALAAARGPDLNTLMALGPTAWRALRLALSRLLREGSPHRQAVTGCLVEQAALEHAVPARIGDYTDFYTSVYHATSIGRQFRPDNPLLPNYKWVPIGYHGRASSVRVSGADFHRPVGQTMPPGADRPIVRPCQRLDLELELGAFIGAGNSLGERIDIAQAEDQLFGLVLLNDWSARDIQAWEYQPLGPFLAKNFATTISPWIVTMEALAPFRRPFARAAGDPAPLPYLDGAHNRAQGAIDIELEALLQTRAMRDAGLAPARLCVTNATHAYWTLAQLVAHHTVGGCDLQPGDLLGTGTLSGPAPDQAGALIELTQGGRQPIALPGGEQRVYLEDGDTVILRGWSQAPGAARVGFGECRATVLPALA